MKKSRNVIYIFIFSIVITMSGISSMHTKAAAVSGDTFVNYALNNCIGKPYVWGGRSPSGFDCSGLVWYVCNHFGINIGSGNQNSQRNYGTPVSFSKSSFSAAIANMQKGDLIFFDYQGDGTSEHVAIYSGNGYAIQAQTYGYLSANINMNTTWTGGKKEWQYICSVRRVIGSATSNPVSCNMSLTMQKTSMNVG